MSTTNNERAALIKLIADELSLTYHCTRVWDAWNVGTMSQDDFESVSESDTPAVLADAILASLAANAPAAEPPSAYELALSIRAAKGWKLGGDKVPVLYTDEINGQQVCRDDVWLCTTAAFAAPPAAEPVATLTPLDRQEISRVLTGCDLWDMHQHMGWYSAPEKNFKAHGESLVRDIERAISAKNLMKLEPASEKQK